MAIVIQLTATDEQLIRIGKDNPGYQVEREEDGTITMSPTHTKTSAKVVEAVAQLWLFAKTAGGKAYGPDAGFAVGPGERLKCPDASWVSQETIDGISEEYEDGFWPVSPDVTIEVKSQTDIWNDTVKKIEMYRERGTTYGVAVNPQTRAVQELGTPPPGLLLDFDAIIDA